MLGQNIGKIVWLRSTIHCCRHIQTTVSSRINAGENLSVTSKAFEDIPEPKSLPILGTLLDYTPIRNFSVEYTFELWRNRHKEHGCIYKEKLPGTQKYTVFYNSPSDTEAVFRLDRTDGNGVILESISRLKEEVGMTDSFSNLNGEDWYKFRKVVNPLLLQNKAVWQYVEKQRLVCTALAKYIKLHLNDNGEVDNFDKVLDKWALEIAGTFVLNTRIGLLNENCDPDVEELVRCNNDVFDFVANSLTGLNIWKYYKTKEFKTAVRGYKKEVDVAKAAISKCPATEDKQTFLERVMDAPHLTNDEKLSLLMDVLLGAIDTTSKAASLLLYPIAVHSEVQEKLRKEIKDLPGEKLDGRILDNMVYMNAFLKEAKRMYPISWASLRWFNEEIVLSGYRIPAGTHIFNTSNATQNINPDYFPEPNSFIPERWISGNEHYRPENRFVYTGAFSLGVRSCPGRRFAMQELRLLLIELLREFKVEYHHKPIVSIFRLTGAPSEKPQYKFLPLL